MIVFPFEFKVIGGGATRRGEGNKTKRDRSCDPVHVILTRDIDVIIYLNG